MTQIEITNRQISDASKPKVRTAFENLPDGDKQQW